MGAVGDCRFGDWRLAASALACLPALALSTPAAGWAEAGWLCVSACGLSAVPYAHAHNHIHNHAHIHIQNHIVEPCCSRQHTRGSLAPSTRPLPPH